MRPRSLGLMAEDPVCGRVVWAPLKSLWINTCLIGFIAGALFATSVSAIVAFLALTYCRCCLDTRSACTESSSIERMTVRRGSNASWSTWA